MKYEAVGKAIEYAKSDWRTLLAIMSMEREAEQRRVRDGMVGVWRGIGRV